MALTVSRLEGIVGLGHARAAAPADGVDGVPAGLVADPGSVDEASAVLQLAHDEGAAVSFRGAGTKLGWGNPPERVDLILSTARLNRILEHAAGDLIVRAEVGTHLRDVQAVVGQAGQWLALDPPEKGATLGGIIATNASGPHRLRYGTVRDLLIGVTYLLPDGTVAKAGGKVVKNVAGYDLCKLFTGSWGTLVLVAECIFRLHPRPAGRATVVAPMETPEVAGLCVQTLLHSSLVLGALEIEWRNGRGRLAALFEGIPSGVAAQVQAAIHLLQPHVRARSLEDDEEADIGQSLTGVPETGTIVLKVSAPVASLPAVLRDVQQCAGGAAEVHGHAGSGIAWVCLPAGEPSAIVNCIEQLRLRTARYGGMVLIRQAPADIKRMAGVWGPETGAQALMQRVKVNFDPGRQLNPGRFVGGL